MDWQPNHSSDLSPYSLVLPTLERAVMHDVYTRGQESQEPAQNSATIPIGQLPTGS